MAQEIGQNLQREVINREQMQKFFLNCLDGLDGNSDGTISKNIWNQYFGKFNEITKDITIDQALELINQSEKTNNQTLELMDQNEKAKIQKNTLKNLTKEFEKTEKQNEKTEILEETLKNLMKELENRKQESPQNKPQFGLE